MNPKQKHRMPILTVVGYGAFLNDVMQRGEGEGLNTICMTEGSNSRDVIINWPLDTCFAVSRAISLEPVMLEVRVC